MRLSLFSLIPLLLSTSAAAAPDLHVKSFKVSVNDRTLTYEVEVCNKGSTVAKTSALELYAHLNNTPTCGLQHSWRYPLPFMNPAACKSFKQIEAGVKPGKYTAWALVDADCKITEAVETNNAAQASYTVDPPDLYIKSFTAQVSGTTVTYQVEVCNKGSSQMKTVDLEIYTNPAGPPTCSTQHSWKVFVHGLGKGKCKTITQVEGGVKPGPLTAWTFIDAGCAAAESDEANNKKSLTTGVGPDAGVPDMGMPDAALPDAAVADLLQPDSAAPDLAKPDMAQPDSSPPDAAAPDSATQDSAWPDASGADSAPPDSGRPDSAALEAGASLDTGASAGDASTTGQGADTGCDCRLHPAAPPHGLPCLAGLLALLYLTRRKNVK